MCWLTADRSLFRHGCASIRVSRFVVRDGSTAYADAIRRGPPGATQVSDRWHLWHGLVRVVVAHSACWSTAAPKYQQLKGWLTTQQRWHAVHDLLDEGVGSLDRSRRLGVSLNTVKRYARSPEPYRLRRPPQYRSCLADPYRDHLRARRAADPGVPVPAAVRRDQHRRPQFALQIRQPSRLDGGRITLPARRFTSWILTRTADLPNTRCALTTRSPPSVRR